jgi:hypothetical protein
MIDLFVLFSFIFIIYEIEVVINPYNYDKQLMETKSNSKEGYLNPNDKSFMIFNIFYFLWTITGLFTQYWIISLSFFLFSLMSSLFTNKEKDKYKRIKLRRMDSTICIGLFITLILSHYL